MTIRTAAYKRTNSAIAQDKGEHDQRTRAIRYAADNGLHFLELFSDVGPGRGINRPGLKSLLAAIDAGEFDALIIDGVDRLSRDPRELDVIAKRLQSARVKIHVILKGLVATPNLGRSTRMNSPYPCRVHP